MVNFGQRLTLSPAFFFNVDAFSSAYSAIRRRVRRPNVPSFFLLIALVQSATAVPIDGDMNPIMRYRLHAHFMERRMRYPTTNTLTK
ncbi:hypothetical protein AAVH_41960 [Aphelenchoides avenae]|nr:hypothetical protein AAVH_41960 [Aphelenchus avenae]